MSTSYPTAIPRRRWLTISGFVAVALLPLAFTGLFVAAAGDGESAIDNIPVALVNNDELQTTTTAEGEEQIVFAGRQLVTELTGADGFEWTITNSNDAEDALARGDVYAILTVPTEFSESILSLSTDAPSQAQISIRTDDSHSYLTGSVAQVVGQSMTDTFGRAITSQYIDGIYASVGELGGALSDAADGATELADGASDFSTGLESYTEGVGSLSSGLADLNYGAGNLDGLTAGVDEYTAGVSQLASTLAAINPAIQAQITDPQLKGTLQAVVDGLNQASAGGGSLKTQTADAVGGIQYGISQSAAGASQLADGSGELTTGATALTSGAKKLATGLSEGAALVPTADDSTDTTTSADIAAEPITLSVTTDNEVSEPAQAIATFFIPLGLWLGALAVFLVLTLPSYRSLASTARNGRIVAATLVRASIVTVVQAVLLVLLLHVVVGVDWALAPATAGFALLMALAFAAFHYFLIAALGRGGLVISLFLLAIQLTSTGGVYPIEALAAPFQAVSPFLPLTYAVEGMYTILSGGSPASAITAAFALLALGLVSVVLSVFAVKRIRKSAATGAILSAADSRAL
ncbi:YhgE/Pip family protein [Salinibacterium sp. SWN1162]|uniref:YhgE/Pip family protein n=1 Tax=Salinibacterium sp. SWN1162 TaxID=2792053 RepID=UPI0018CDEA6E|nr:YhgE/Pip family protein [Salinibacterium sp. SWN1162]MBH0008805.1 YhgE/Pip family protein [Salinibacterium sp. SWN1162]